MTDVTSIARPYAKAAFEFALENQKLEVWSDWLALLAQVVGMHDCVEFITDPTATPAQQNVLMSALIKKYCPEPADVFMHNFVALLIRNKRLLVLASIYQLFQDYRAAYEKTMTVEVYSFDALTEEQIKRLTVRLSKRLQRQVTLLVHIDPDLLGGAVIRADNFVFDGSVRTQLKKLSAQLVA